MTFNDFRRGPAIAGREKPASFIARWSMPVTAGSMLLAMIATASAQRSRFDNERQGIPVATNRIHEEPDTYYGKVVTVSAGVERVLSKTAFVVDQQRRVAGTSEMASVGKPVLVIAPYLSGTLQEKSYLWVRGEVVKVEPAVIV